MHWLLALIPAVSAFEGQTTPAQPGSTVTPPKGIPETFLTDLDYPKDALRLRQEGLSVVQLRISTKGRVKACSVQQSSGSPSLDAATCVLARDRRFKPARDGQGKAVEGDAPMRINWRLPQR